MREYSVPVLVDVPASAGLADTVFRRAEQEPGAVVMRRKTGAGWPVVTAAEFRDQVVEVAKGLIAAGVEHGDRVALMSRTRYEWTLVDYAIWAVGAVTVPIYETSSVEQVRWILHDSDAKAAFVELDGHEEAVREAAPELKAIWRVDGTLETGDVTAADVEERRKQVTSADLATVVYTSGTTGRPKGCRITHDNLLFTALNVLRGPLEPLFARKDPAALLFLPLAHIFARMIQVVLIEAGAIMAHTPNMKNVAPDLQDFKPTFLLGVPRVFEKVYNSAEQKAISGGKGKIFARAVDVAVAWSKAESTGGAPLGLRLQRAVFDRLVYSKLRAATGGRLSAAVCGGSALGERLGHFFRGVGIEVFEGYGLTETSAPLSVNMPGANKIGTVGKPLPGVTLHIGDDGEILAKGRNVFHGYWKNDEATADVIDPEGWFHTGDIGELDADGYLRITGRKKEILVTAAGKNVAPGPLEDALRAHPLISQAMIVGDGRPFVAALITLDPEALPAGAKVAELRGDPKVQAEIQAAVDRANQSVSKAEQIKKFLILDGDITEESGHLTPTLKVKRSLVMRDFAKDIDDLYGGH
ncbi:Long-chain-fatty-acid--CoA ligase [[Actinomadura] parvosata subsp. kistnae]|uniref:Acyl-CoA synthetase n=1 Tax=[Actinomadura] parvosata subsp. kistnae TaxID=1909395 RepID=A0A1V0A3Y7_9ACTN|nr:AMP-dependent synthetase/ligase [Nonomuraea sp. ATCC 55076]AQZ64920.1 long-chain fatty acid--CoA ligase [Nonomuraea sp. ATCC 55076]SPL96147.1 Long-chain-fatty-acid--CoA ligase [Actinomadura parvosata subsp. kistnae]